MAIDAINTALSGLYASSKTLAVSANNIANAQSTTSNVNGQTVNQPYVPQAVSQQSVQGGGVSTSLRDVQPASINIFSPEDPSANEQGMVAMPNVNLDQEVANTSLAANTYKANAAVIKRANETFQSLLDVMS